MSGLQIKHLGQEATVVARQTAPGAGTPEGIFDLHIQDSLPVEDSQAVEQNEEAPERLLEGHSARRLAVDRTCSLRDRLS